MPGVFYVCIFNIHKLLIILARSSVRLSKANLTLATAYITGHGHLRNIWQPLQGDISCILCGQAPQSAKHTLLNCEPNDIRRIRLKKKKRKKKEEEEKEEKMKKKKKEEKKKTEEKE